MGHLPFRRPPPPSLRLGVVVTFLVSAPPSGPAGAQQSLAERTSTPEQAATLFLRSVRAIRWQAVSQFLHPETLGRFHELVTTMVELDPSGGVRSYLSQADSAGYRELDAATVFHRSIGTVIDDMPGLMHALYDRDDEVLGHVPEGDDNAHVVYRTTARISGAVSEVKIIQLGRTAAGWRVRWSDELEVLDAALRGVPRGGRDASGARR